jgi:hypothetical protein
MNLSHDPTLILLDYSYSHILSKILERLLIDLVLFYFSLIYFTGLRFLFNTQTILVTGTGLL